MDIKKYKANIKFNSVKSSKKKPKNFCNLFTENLTDNFPYVKETINSFDIFDNFLIKENNQHYFSEKEKSKSVNKKDIMPNYSNLKKEITDKKNKFRNYFNIGNSIFKEIQSKNSFIVKSFKKGCASYFFGPNGIVTKQYKPLKDYYDAKTRGLDLSNKIYTGKLDYYDLVTEDHDSYGNRLNFSKKKFLSISKNLMVIHSDFEKINEKVLERKENSKKNFVHLNIKKVKGYNQLSKKELEKIVNDNKIKAKNLAINLKRLSAKAILKNKLNKLNKTKSNSLNKLNPIKEIIMNINQNKTKGIVKARNSLRKKILEKNTSIQKIDSLPFFYITSVTKENNKSNNNSNQLSKNNSLHSFNNNMKNKIQNELNHVCSFNNDLKKYIKNYNKTFCKSFFDKKSKKIVDDPFLYEDLKENEYKNDLEYNFNKIELPKRIKHLLVKK